MPINEGSLDRSAIAALVGLATTDKISFYGVSAVAQQSIAANGTDAATTQALANDLKAKLKLLGFLA